MLKVSKLNPLWAGLQVSYVPTALSGMDEILSRQSNNNMCRIKLASFVFWLQFCQRMTSKLNKTKSQVKRYKKRKSFSHCSPESMEEIIIMKSRTKTL